MKTRITISLLLISSLPFLLIVLVNEFSRAKISGAGYKVEGIKTINPLLNTNHRKCSWICYQSTGICKDYHVKVLKPYLSKTDNLYFGLIGAMNGTKHYVWANVLFLFVLWPLLMFFLLRRVIINYFRIRTLKRTISK